MRLWLGGRGKRATTGTWECATYLMFGLVPKAAATAPPPGRYQQDTRRARALGGPLCPDPCAASACPSRESDRRQQALVAARGLIRRRRSRDLGRDIVSA